MVCLVLVQIVLLYVGIYSTTETKSYTEDYGWRDFEGTIPPDAFAAGLNEKEEAVYIGQALFEAKLIPGKILPHSDKIYFEWYQKEISTSNNVKILCSNQAYKLEWLSTHHDQISLLTNKILLKGGYEQDYATYIGRTVKDGVSNVGKVICKTDDCYGLYTTNNGTTMLSQDFQVLTYNPNAKKNMS